MHAVLNAEKPMRTEKEMQTEHAQVCSGLIKSLREQLY